MKLFRSSHFTRVSNRLASVLVAACLLQGCQTYEPTPLDLPAYRASFDARLLETEPINAFLTRLQARGDLVPATFDASDGLSPAEGEVIALFYNPDLRLARLEAGVALADWETAGLWEDPVFGFDGANIISPSGVPFEWGLGLSLTIPISGRLAVEKDLAGAGYEVELRRIIDAEWRTRTRLRTAWAEWTAAKERHSLIESTIDQLHRLDTIVASLAAAGELNLVERRLFTVELAARDAELTESKLEVIQALTSLLGVLGLPPQASELLVPTLPSVVMPIHADTTARLIEANTELAVHFAEYQVAEESLRLEIRKQFPDIVIGSGYGTEFNDHRVMFGLSVPIPILNANRAAIATARAHREVVRATAETTFADLERRLAAAVQSVELAMDMRAAFEERIVPLLEAQMHDLQRIAEFGEIDMFVMLETTARQLDAGTRLLALQLAELNAAYTAVELLGPDSPLPPAPIITDAPNEGGT